MLGAGEDISDCRSDLGVSEGRFCGAPPNSSLNTPQVGSIFATRAQTAAGPSGMHAFSAPQSAERIPHSEEMLSFYAAAGPKRCRRDDLQENRSDLLGG